MTPSTDQTLNQSKTCIIKQNRSAEGCSKFKDTSLNIKHIQDPKWDRTEWVSVLCWHVTPFARSWVVVMSDQWRVSVHIVKLQNVMRERQTLCYVIWSPYRSYNFFRNDFIRFLIYPCPRILFESHIALGTNIHKRSKPLYIVWFLKKKTNHSISSKSHISAISNKADTASNEAWE